MEVSAHAMQQKCIQRRYTTTPNTVILYKVVGQTNSDLKILYKVGYSRNEPLSCGWLWELILDCRMRDAEGVRSTSAGSLSLTHSLEH